MKKSWTSVLAFSLLTIFALATSAESELMVTDLRTGKSIPARLHPDTEKYFVKKGVEFVFLKGSTEAMKVSGVSLDDSCHLLTPNGRRPFLDLLDPKVAQVTKSFCFLRTDDGKLLINGFLKDSGIVQFLCDKGAVSQFRTFDPKRDIKNPEERKTGQNI